MKKKELTQKNEFVGYAHEMLFDMLETPDAFGFALFISEDGELDGRILKYKEEPPSDAFLVVRASSVEDMQKAVRILNDSDMLDEFEQVEIMLDTIIQMVSTADSNVECVQIDFLELAQIVEDAEDDDTWEELWPQRPHEI